MADFEAQVNGITNLGIDGTSTDPGQTELTQFLKDGVIDVTNRCIQFKPQNRDLFMNVTGLQVAQGANIDAADIISVVRADGVTAGNFRSCRKISPSMQSRVADTESLHFASKFNPVYMINADGTVHVFPAPSDNSGKDSYQVYYVNNTPLDGSGTALTYADSTLGYFPADKIYLVVIYASIKSLQASLASASISTFSLTTVPPDVPSISAIGFSESNALTISATDPTAITLTTVNYSAASATASTVLSSLTAPAYTKPGHPTQVSFEDFFNLTEDGNPFGDNDPGAFSLTAVPPDVPIAPSYTTPSINTSTVSAVTIGSLGTAPTYTSPVVGGVAEEITATMDADSAGYGTDADFLNFSKWFSVAGDLIEDEEDSELAQVQLQKISAYIQAYSGAMQNQLNIFNDSNTEYQSTVQEAIQNAQIASQKAATDAQLAATESQQEASLLLQKEQQEYVSILQRYSAELQEYQAEVTAEVQEYGQKLQRYQFEIGNVYTAWAKTESDNLQVFQLDIQNELNEFNKEQASFQYEVQKALADANSTNQIAMQNGVQEAQDAIQNNNAQVSRFQSMSQHYATQVNEDVQKYTSQLQGDVQTMQGDITTEQNKLAKYQAELVEYQAEITAEIQAYQQELAEKSAEYQWKTARLQDLKQEYDQAFAIMAPPPPQQQQARQRAR